MKGRPVKIQEGAGYVQCEASEATHLMLNLPGPTGHLVIPVIQHGTRRETPCWTWNGNIESPTLKPSVLSKMGRDGSVVCHSWINDGKVQFLADCTHEFKGQTLDLLEVEYYS